MAGKRIQGITIELNGDSTGLTKALEGVNKKIQNTQAQLKDVNKLLKLDPGNTELLAQKQQLLGDAVKATREKLETLKTAGEQANDALAKGDITRQQYDALQREIIETENDMKSLTKEMKNFGSVSAQQLSAAGEKVKKVGEKITSVGTGMTKYVTGPIVAAGAAAVAAFNEVDDGTDIIIKKTGETGDALADMQQRANNLATSIPTDFRTAGSAIGEVYTRFNLTGDALQSLSGKFIKFAQLNDTDVSTSVDHVQSVMAAFNLRNEQAGNVLDALNAASQETGVSVDKLATDMSSNATALREMKMNAVDAAFFLARMEKNGIDSSTALTGMKTALKTATKNGQTMAEAMDQLEKKIAGAKSKTAAMAAATEVFGSKAGPALGAALYEGRLSLDELGYSMDAFAGNVDKTFEATQDPMDEFKVSMNELKITGADLVESAAPLIKTFAEGLKKTVQDIKSWWNGLSPASKELIIKLIAVAAAVGPILIIVGKVTTGIGSILSLAPKIMDAANSLGSTVSGLFSLLAANPIALVIAAIAALVAAFVYLWNKCEGFRKFWQNLWEGIKNTAKKVWDSITGIFKTAIDKIKDFFSFKWLKIKLPHFSIEGSFSLVPPKVPRLKVDWYKKAMEDGMILTSPTIFGASNGRLMGGGEAGPEAIVGTSSLKNMIFAAVGEGMKRSGGRASRNMTVILEVNGQVAARTMVPLLNTEVQRYGTKLETT